MSNKVVPVTNKAIFKILGIGIAVSLVFMIFAGNIAKLAGVSILMKNRPGVSDTGSAGDSGNNNGGGTVNPVNPVTPVTPSASDTTVPADPTGAGGDNNTTQGGDTTAPDTQSQGGDTTAKPSESDTTTTTKATTTTEATDSAAQIKEKKSILSTFKTVVNTANRVTKPGFTKVEYRALATDDIKSKIHVSLIGKAFPDYFVTESTAKASPMAVAKGSDMTEFCLDNDYYACLIATGDASPAIKEATKATQDDGTIKIVITLRDEKNPAPTPADSKSAASYTGGMFNVLSQTDAKAKAGSALKVSSIESLNLTYTGCTVTLVYNPINGHVISLTQSVKCNADASVKLGLAFDITGVMTDVTEYSDFNY